jgi:hypothetical protein
MDGLTKDQVKLSLSVGTIKKNIRLTPHASGRKFAYDFFAVTDVLKGSYFHNGRVGITDFSNPTFFKMNYAGNILFHMSAPTVDFLN